MPKILRKPPTCEGNGHVPMVLPVPGDIRSSLDDCLRNRSNRVVPELPQALTRLSRKGVEEKSFSRAAGEQPRRLSGCILGEAGIQGG